MALTYSVLCDGKTYNGTTLYQAISLALDRHGHDAPLRAFERSKLIGLAETTKPVGEETIRTWRTYYRETAIDSQDK